MACRATPPIVHSDDGVVIKYEAVLTSEPAMAEVTAGLNSPSISSISAVVSGTAPDRMVSWPTGTAYQQGQDKETDDKRRDSLLHVILLPHLLGPILLAYMLQYSDNCVNSFQGLFSGLRHRRRI